MEVHKSAVISCLLGERSLPGEIVDMIANEFGKPDIFRLSTLSSKLRDLVYQVIYYDVSIDFECTHSMPKGPKLPLNLFLRTLLGNPYVATCVRRLSLTGDPLYYWRDAGGLRLHKRRPFLDYSAEPLIFADLGAFNDEEAYLFQKKLRKDSNDPARSAGQVTFPLVVLQVIKELRHIEFLRIHSDFFRFPSISYEFCAHAEAGGLKHLKSAEYCGDLAARWNPHKSVSMVRDWDPVLLTPFASQDIEYVGAFVPLSNESLRLSPATQLRKLVLVHYEFKSTGILGELLAATPQLRHFEYHLWVDYGWHKHHLEKIRLSNSTESETFEIDPIFDSILQVAGTLETLIISEQFHNGSDAFVWRPTTMTVPRHKHSDAISQLHRLETLEIPLALLLGWGPRSFQQSWDRVLPSSICHLTLTDHLLEYPEQNRQDHEDLIPLIRDLLQWLAKLPQRDPATPFDIRLLCDNRIKSKSRKIYFHKLGSALKIPYTSDFKHEIFV